MLNHVAWIRRISRYIKAAQRDVIRHIRSARSKYRTQQKEMIIYLTAIEHQTEERGNKEMSKEHTINARHVDISWYRMPGSVITVAYLIFCLYFLRRLRIFFRITSFRVPRRSANIPTAPSTFLLLCENKLDCIKIFAML